VGLLPPCGLYVTGLLNSKLLNWYYQNIINPEIGEALAQLKRGHLAELSIKLPSSKEQNSHDQIVKLVDNLLKLNEQLQTTRIEIQQQQIQRTIDHAEKKIDELVYGLYGLSKKEIEIIEHN